MSKSYYEEVYYKLLGDYFRERRESKGLTLEELSKIFKVNRNTYYCYERGTRACSLELFIELCKYYGDDYLIIFKDLNERTKSIVNSKGGKWDLEKRAILNRQ